MVGNLVKQVVDITCGTTLERRIEAYTGMVISIACRNCDSGGCHGKCKKSLVKIFWFDNFGSNWYPRNIIDSERGNIRTISEAIRSI